MSRISRSLNRYYKNWSNQKNLNKTVLPAKVRRFCFVRSQWGDGGDGVRSRCGFSDRS
ncbi:MAG: hypothetical protein ACYTXA_24100 [Nostoc sp.]